MELNDRIALIIGRQVIQIVQSQERIEALQQALAAKESENKASEQRANG